MSMNKFVVAGGLMAGAAFALAPLASADDALASVVSGEIASMNFLFEGDTLLSGNSDAVTTSPGSFDTVTPADITTVQGDGTTATLFDYLVYGLNPTVAGLASDPGAYNVFNGAMVPFDDGINSLLYAAMNNGDALTWASGDLFGGASAMDIATNATTGWDEASSFFQLAMGDLMGYFGIFEPPA